MRYIGFSLWVSRFFGKEGTSKTDIDLGGMQSMFRRDSCEWKTTALLDGILR